MDRASLVVALQESLQDAASRLDGAEDLERCLELAALDFGRVRPRTIRGAITLEAGVGEYAAPAGLQRIEVNLWGLSQRRSYRPWEPGWPGPLPDLRVMETGSGRLLVMDPPPTSAQIVNAGATCAFYYRAAHSVGEDEADTTIAAADAGLLLLRAQAEAMHELAQRGVTKPVRLRDGQTQGAKNGTPAALWDHCMRQFEKQAA